MSAWYKKQKKGSIDLIGIAIDRKENLPPFLKTTPVSYPIWHYAGKDNRSFMKNLGNSVGALPFTTVEAVKCGKKEAILGGVDSKKTGCGRTKSTRRMQIKAVLKTISTDGEGFET